MFRILQRLALALFVVLTGCADVNIRVLDGCDVPTEVRLEYVVPIVVHKPLGAEPVSGAPVVRDHVDDMIDKANFFLGDFDISLARVETVYEDYDVDIVIDAKNDINDRADLVTHNIEMWDDGRLHVYIIESIWNKDKHRQFGGFFYQLSGERCAGMIAVLDSGTSMKILAHEVGHALGLGHVDDPTNLMFPENLRKAMGFDDEQGKTMLGGVKYLLCECWT